MATPSLHEYQRRAVEFIKATPKCALFVEMGLGKTVSTLTAIYYLVFSWLVGRVLVIAPKRVALSTWTNEVRKWPHLSGLTISVAVGSEAERLKAIRAGSDITVVNRDVVTWLVEQFGDAWPWDMVVIDESSSFKDASTKRFKALRRVAKKVGRMVLLTGTPSPNSALELWPQIYLLDGGERLGRSMTAYKTAYFDSDYMGYKWTPKQGATQTIYSKISDLCLTLRTEDWLAMPERIDNIVDVDLGRALDTYRAMERDYLLPISTGETITAANAAVLAGKLLQLAQGAIYTDGKEWEAIHEAKLDTLDEIISDATGPALVAYQFKHDLERLKARFGKRLRTLDGPAELDAWNAGKFGSGDILAAHPASAGHGLNLQDGGALVIWFSLTWSLEQYLQFNARLHRQGQTRTVIVHHLVARGTIDEDVLAALEAKRTGQDALLDALKHRAGTYREREAA